MNTEQTKENIFMYIKTHYGEAIKGGPVMGEVFLEM